MSNADIAARLTAALEDAANREAGQTALASVSIDMVGAGDGAVIETALVRKTRTLLFMSAECKSNAGARIASASSVHKVNA